MNGTRWNPWANLGSRDAFRELEDVADRLSRALGRSLRPRNEGEEAMTSAEWVPAVDVLETDSDYVIRAELPGIKKEDVKISVENGVLTIQGERKQETQEKGYKFHRVERAYGVFTRSFTVPDSVEESKVKAEFKDGLLSVHLPKSEKVRPKQIEVKIG
jgi:HSP20 family protein